MQSPRCPSWQRRCVTVCAGASGGSSDDQPPSGSLIPDTLPVASADSDWRAFRAQLVAAAAASEAAPAAAGAGADAAAPASSARSDGAWAHMLRGPEQGCLLVASPLMFQTSQVGCPRHRAPPRPRSSTCLAYALAVLPPAGQPGFCLASHH